MVALCEETRLIMVEMMVLLCKMAQSSYALKKWPQHECPLTEVEVEYQAQALSGQSPSEGLTHPPFL